MKTIERSIVHPQAYTLAPQKNSFWSGPTGLLVYFIGLFLFLLAFSFQGLDMLDEGFHATQYQRFFSDPSSVQYTFIYWLSGFIGGSFYKIFPFLGLWGLRLAGALVTTFTAALAYQMLKRHVKYEVLLPTLAALAALSIQSDSRDIYYNNISAFFYVLAIFLLNRGLIRDSKGLLLLSGLVVGINVFTRLPNALGGLLALTILYNEHLNGWKDLQWLKKGSIFVAGYLAGIVSIFLLMYGLGHLDLFFNSIRILYQISSNASTSDGMNGSYGMGNMLLMMAGQFIKSCAYFILAGSGAVLVAFILQRYGDRTGHRLLRIGLSVLAATMTIYLLASGKLGSTKVGFLLAGCSIITAIPIILQPYSRSLKILTLSGILFILIHPVGSALGIYTVIAYTLWISLPLAFQYLCSLQRIGFAGKDRTIDDRYVRQPALNRTWYIGFFLLVLAILYGLYSKPYFFDFHDRTEMTHTIDSRTMPWIYTSEPRARMINELLQAGRTHIAPGSSVLAYDCIPMFHFMSETRPFLTNPAPFFYSSALFGQQLNEQVASSKEYPVIVRQNIKTFEDDGSRWPEEQPASPYLSWPRNKDRNLILDKFIRDNGYAEVWHNAGFSIWTVAPGWKGPDNEKQPLTK